MKQVKKKLFLIIILLFLTCFSMYSKVRDQLYNMKIDRIDKNLYLVTLNFLFNPKAEVGSGLILFTIISCDLAEFGVKKDFTYMMISPIEGKMKRDEEQNISRLNVYFSESENKNEFINSIKQKSVQVFEVFETKEYFKQCTEYLESRKK